MTTIQLQEKLHGYGQWRKELIGALDRYTRWLDTYDAGSESVREAVQNLRENLRCDRVVVAFAAEFSRGKTELINALFFADTGLRLLPSAPGRTTMCPTEIFHDSDQGSYIRLLPIETRLNEITLSEHKKHHSAWIQKDLDTNSPAQMQEAFQALAAVKKVSLEDARKLGLFSAEVPEPDSVNLPETVEIPCWRHALISFPHKLLKAGLSVLDTPGLNALGAEPELTLRMLPSAQAVIFVLAADTGVTRSDLDMWNSHVQGSRHAGKMGLAVAMNKIDAMWGDLGGEEATERSIRSQVVEASRVLGVDEVLIFPVSAKQALLAKVNRDDDLLEKSRLEGIESYLSGSVINDRQVLVQGVVTDVVGSLIVESLSHLEFEMMEAEGQIEVMRKIDLKNRGMIRSLMEETRQQQTRYMACVDSFQSGRNVFLAQVRLLMEALSPATINPIVRTARQSMIASLTTPGMKAAMKSVLDDLLASMEKALAITDETRRLIKAIYSRFEAELGFSDLKPWPFSLKKYQVELEQIFEEGEEFRRSASATLMEQGVVVRKLYTTVIADACGLFAQAHQETADWGGRALAPLVRRLQDRKRMIEKRLETLRKVSESSEALTMETDSLEKRLRLLREQYAELKEIQLIVAPAQGS